MAPLFPEKSATSTPPSEEDHQGPESQQSHPQQTKTLFPWEDDFDDHPEPRKPHRSKRWIILFTIIFLLVAGIGLGVGLGVGLHNRNETREAAAAAAAAAAALAAPPVSWSPDGSTGAGA